MAKWLIFQVLSCPACIGGDMRACVSVAISYLGGQGVKNDRSKSKYWYGVACDGGHQGGCDSYSKLNEAGVQ